MPTYKLCYFDIRGLAEVSRWMFKVAKVDFEDYRLSIAFGTPGDFSTIIRPEFDAAKASGELAASLGKLPYLEVDGVKIGQSKAIERFIAREFGLMGSNPVEAVQIDQLCETIIDFKAAYNKAKGASDAVETEAAVTKYFAEDLAASLALAEKSIPAGPGPFLVGSKVSYADLVFYMFLASPGGFHDNAEGAKAAFQGCPKIKAAMEAVDKIPELQGWIATRKVTMF
mmetsp:Transcript_111135/g.354068  ORF Transcript_111135/g.354068 Transcript_111135/m.354068 type:complete len:227 (+) Transcript_111135:50-730(+)